MEGDFINLNRKILEWEWWTDHNTLIVWLYLLLKANWTDGRFKGVVVPRGSLITSRAHIALDCGLSEQQVRTALDHLISTNEITKTGYAKYTVISITNYEKYQFINQVDNQQSTNNQPTSNHNIKREKGKKEKIEGTPALDSLISKYGADFVNERVERAKGYSGITIEKIAQWCEEDSKKVKPFKKNTFNNFTARTYDFDDVERRLLRKETQ